MLNNLIIAPTFVYKATNTSTNYVILIPELSNNAKIRKAYTNDEDTANMYNFRNLTPFV